MVRWIVVLCLAALGSNVLLAATGSIRGRVEDPAGSLIASASVILENEQTGFLHSSLTDSQGEFIFPGLAPGSYQLRATAAGYSDTVMPIHLDIDQTEVIELSMRIAPRQETVVASARLWNEPASWGAVITGNDISSLPLNEHNFMTFALLAPGAQMEASGSQLSSQGGGVSVSGGREQSNSFLLDGNDNNDPFVRQYSALAPMDAVQEFKVQGSGSDVQFGGNSGGQINVVLRSGENAFHGSASEYLRNRHLDARNYFDLPPCAGLSTGITCGNIPRLDRSQFGGTLGGPIHRGQTLFFLAYEGVSLRQAATRTATVPSQDQRAVALAAVPDWIRNPAGVAVFDRLPAANVGFDLATSNLFVSTPVIRNTGNHLSLKIDHRIGDRDQFAFHYVFADDDRSYPFDPLLPSTNLPGYGSSAWDRGQNAGLTWSRPLHPRAINELRAGFNRHIGQWMQEHAGQDVSAELGFPNVVTRPADLGVPLITIAGFDGIGEPRNLPQDRRDTTLIASENLIWTPRFGGGHHEIRTGGNVSHFQYAGYLDVLARGQWFFMGAFTGNALQDLLLGLPTYALGVKGDTDAVLTTSGSAVYLQDHWRANERMALTIGARWEFATPPAESHDRISVPDLSSGSLTCSPQPDCQFIRAGTRGLAAHNVSDGFSRSGSPGWNIVSPLAQLGARSACILRHILRDGAAESNFLPARQSAILFH